jgi:hypothetical protein
VAGELPGSYTQEFVAAALGQRIEFMLAERVFDDEDLEVTDDDRSNVTEQLQGALDDIPEGLRNSLIDDLSRRVRLQDELGQQGYGEAITEAADATEIEVSSHYGSWDRDQYTVVPPDGPVSPDGEPDGESPAEG